MIPANQKYDALFTTRKVFFYGLLTMIPYYLWNPAETEAFISHFSASHFALPVLWNLLYLGVIASMGCFLVWNWVIRRLGAVEATNWVYINPVSTILFAWWLLSEHITVWFLLGTILILVGMYFCDKKK
jgi:drug/metabolite transporter (DMT)-like permease